MSTSLHLWLRSGRAATGMSQRDLAAAVGVGTPYISKIEAGKEIPSDELLCRIAAVLGLDADELIVAAGRIPATYLTALQNRPDQAVRMLRQFTFGDLPTGPTLYECSECGRRFNSPVCLERVPGAIIRDGGVLHDNDETGKLCGPMHRVEGES